MAAGKAAAAIEPLTLALKFEEHLDRPDDHLMLAELRGVALIKAGELDQAEEAFLEALTLPTAEKDEEKQAVQLGRLGYARFLNGDVNGARDGFARALHLFTASGNPEAGKALSEICQPLLKDVRAYWTLSGEFRLAAEDHRMKAELEDGFRDAEHALGLYLDKLFNLGPDAGEATGFLPIVTPIAVEMAQDLVPTAVMEDSAAPWHLIESLIPKMRDRIRQDVGVEIPGVRIRGNEGDMSPGTYIIFIQDVPLVMGTVYADRHFVHAPQEGMQELEIPAEAVVASVNPVTGDPGVWVDPAYLEPLEATGLEVWKDPLVYMIRHLEAVLRNNLALFLGIQDVAELLEAQKEEFDDPDLIRSALPDRKSRLRFGQLLRALVSEQVPILALQDILGTVREVGMAGDDIHDTVRTVRQRLIRQLPTLPGHLPQSALVWAPESFEQGIARWLMTHEEKVFFAVPAEETQELLNEFREFVGEQGDAFVLGVQDASVRPFARRLIELEFPRIHVVAAEELGT